MLWPFQPDNLIHPLRGILSKHLTETHALSKAFQYSCILGCGEVTGEETLNKWNLHNGESICWLLCLGQRDKVSECVEGADKGFAMDCKNLIANANKMPRLELPALAQTAKDLFWCTCLPGERNRIKQWNQGLFCHRFPVFLLEVNNSLILCFVCKCLI